MPYFLRRWLRFSMHKKHHFNSLDPNQLAPRHLGIPETFSAVAVVLLSYHSLKIPRLLRPNEAKHIYVFHCCPQSSPRNYSKMEIWSRPLITPTCSGQYSTKHVHTKLQSNCKRLQPRSSKSTITVAEKSIRCFFFSQTSLKKRTNPHLTI